MTATQSAPPALSPTSPAPVTDHVVVEHYRRFLEALRPGRARPQLVAALGGDVKQLCAVLDAKYEPGVSATVQYLLGDRLVRGDVLGVGSAVGEATGDSEPEPPAGLRLRLSCFPDDPGMPTLPVAADAAQLTAALAEAGVGHAQGRHPVRLELLRYRAGRRATFRVTGPSRPGAGPGTLVAKCYHQPRKAAAVAAEAQALSFRGQDLGPLVLAPFAGHLPAMAVVLHETVGGRPLDVALPRAARTGSLTPAADLRSVAAALAAFHRLPPVSDRPRPVRRELARFAARAQGVSLVHRGTGAALAGLTDRLTALADSVPASEPGLVHGDCKPSQFLLDGDQVALLDLDHCGLADPASDLGTFVASLRQLAVRQWLARRVPAGPHAALAWADRLTDVFLAAYCEAARLTAGAARDLRRRVDWYEGVALERKALRAFARAPLSPMPSALVDEAQRRLDTTLGGS